LSLKEKTARGSLINIAFLFGMRPLVTLFNILLLRLLNPEDFGLVAMAMVLVGPANQITNLGMNSAIIQTKDDLEKVSFYSFITVMLASTLATALIIIFANPISEFLGGGNELVPILRWLAIYISIGGLIIIPQALLSRQLKFGTMTLLGIPNGVVFLALAIPLAWMGYGVWSLVIGRILAQLLTAILHWAFCRPWIWLRPKRWDSAVIRRLREYGTFTTSTQILRFVQTQGDTWYVGRVFGTTGIGFYSKAYDLTTHITSMLTRGVFGSVLFPSYSKIQDDRPRLARAYLKSTNLVFLVIVPIALGMVVIAPLLVKTLIGEKWLPIIPLLQVFSLYGFTYPISANSSPIFRAVGQPNKDSIASLVLLGVMIPSILILSRSMGVVGVAIAVGIAYVVAMFFNVYQINSLLPGTAKKTLTMSLPSLLSGGLMVAGVLLLQDLIYDLTGGENVIALILLIVIGALIYGATTLLLQRDLMLEIFGLIIKSLGIDRRWPRLVPQRMRSTK
jgi:O-antigen/teichoic acid export membrane protein